METGVTDAGLVNLQGLHQLEYLKVSGPQITDAGLAHLQGLSHLEGLLLIGTKVTDAATSRISWGCRSSQSFGSTKRQ